MEKRFDGNYTRLLRAILNKSWRQHPTKQQLYDHLPPISKTIQIRRTRHARYCWRSKDELISDVLLWTPTYGRAKAGRPARTYIQQLCEDMGCSPEDLPEAMNDREKWRERVRDILSSGTIWWWWWLNKSWRQHPTKQQLYDHQPPIAKTIQIRRTRHAGYCWRSKDELISDVFLWTPSHGWARVRWPARTYQKLLYTDTGGSLDDLPGVMDDSDDREIRASGTSWWWYYVRARHWESRLC